MSSPYVDLTDAVLSNANIDDTELDSTVLRLSVAVISPAKIDSEHTKLWNGQEYVPVDWSEQP